MPDKTLKCIECSQDYIFTDKEQLFYNERGFQEPKRCAACRAARKRSHGSSRGGGFNDQFNKGKHKW